MLTKMGDAIDSPRHITRSDLACLAGQSFRLEPLSVCVERSLSFLMLTHSLFGIGLAGGVSGLALLARKDSGRANCIIIRHEQITRRPG
jgi:hypothetical protein